MSEFTEEQKQLVAEADKEISQRSRFQETFQWERDPRHIAILGPKGICKSTLMAYMVKRLQSENPDLNIFSNIDIYAGDLFKQTEPSFNGKGEPELDEHLTKIRAFRTIMRAKNGILALDDVVNMLPARRHSTDYNLSMGILSTKIRKKKLGLIYTDQYVKGVDLFIRNNVDEICKPMGKPRIPSQQPLSYWVYEKDNPNFDSYQLGPTPFTPKLDTEPIPCARLWKFFNSWQVTEASYTDPFRVRSYGKAFVNWCDKNNIALVRFSIGSSGLNAYINAYEEAKGKPLGQNQRGALKAYLDMQGLLKRNEP